jgi:Fe-S-cluster containining protein
VSDDTLDAGELTSWLAGMQATLQAEREADVPCEGCTACCRSSQFVHIEPDETDALAHIPTALRFPAPGRRQGHIVLGYDEHGRCPMLGDHGCTIYAHRPRTCRTYDCRVFTATGTEPDPSQPAIAERVRRWRFTVATDDARTAWTDLHHAARAPGPDADVPLARALRAIRAAPSPARPARRGSSPRAH